MYFLGRVLIDLNRLDEAKLYLIRGGRSRTPSTRWRSKVLTDLNAGKVNTGETVVQAGFDPMAARPAGYGAVDRPESDTSPRRRGVSPAP